MRPEDDGAQATARKQTKRKQRAEAENQACRATEIGLGVKRDGTVRLLVWSSFDRYWLQQKREGRGRVNPTSQVHVSVMDTDGKWRSVASRPLWHSGRVCWHIGGGDTVARVGDGWAD